MDSRRQRQHAASKHHLTYTSPPFLELEKIRQAEQHPGRKIIQAHQLKMWRPRQPSYPPPVAFQTPALASPPPPPRFPVRMKIHVMLPTHVTNRPRSAAQQLSHPGEMPVSREVRYHNSFRPPGSQKLPRTVHTPDEVPADLEVQYRHSFRPPRCHPLPGEANTPDGVPADLEVRYHHSFRPPSCLPLPGEVYETPGMLLSVNRTCPRATRSPVSTSRDGFRPT